jgi:DNA segregation ATPase FtsK/SpoIIIE-like protein
VAGGGTLVGRYRLDERLGLGAMGEVWKGFDLRLHREVAVKVLPNHLAMQTRRVERFRDEAKIGAALQHPGIVVVFDADEHEGRLFFVMELLAGDDLAKVLSRSRNGLSIERVSWIGEQVADALAAAHSENVIHRDVKPGNVMILANDRTKLCDFGVARMMQSHGGRATSGVGTAAYMAPEQFDGRLDERADLYSLGCLLYESLTGDRPFLGSPQQLMYHHVNTDPRPPTQVRAEIPPELEELVLALLAKDPAKRPQKAEVVATRLKGVRTGTRSHVQERTTVRHLAVKMHENTSGRVAKQRYQLPSVRLLKSGTPAQRRTGSNETAMKVIGHVLAMAGLDAEVAGYTRGPSSSLYEIRLGPGTTSDEIVAVGSRIASAVGNTDIRIISGIRSGSPLPGVEAVGVEVPNTEVDIVSLGDVLRDLPVPEGERRLLMGLGRDVHGASVAMDLAQSPHMLIGGKAGAAVSDPILTIITSALIRASPSQVRITLVDSTAGRLAPFAGLPHLIEPIVTSPRAGAETLRWTVGELDRRYDDLATAGCRTIRQFNQSVLAGHIPAPVTALGGVGPPHPYVVVVVDELGEAMRAAPQAVEESISQLTRLGRAVGIHVVLRTTQPDDRTVTSRIKAYVPARLGCSLASMEASLRVLDRPGAESLGSKTALFRAGGGDTPRLLQLAQVSEPEIEAVVDHCRLQS